MAAAAEGQVKAAGAAMGAAVGVAGEVAAAAGAGVAADEVVAEGVSAVLPFGHMLSLV